MTVVVSILQLELSLVGISHQCNLHEELWQIERVSTGRRLNLQLAHMFMQPALAHRSMQESDHCRMRREDYEADQELARWRKHPDSIATDASEWRHSTSWANQVQSTAHPSLPPDPHPSPRLCLGCAQATTVNLADFLPWLDEAFAAVGIPQRQPRLRPNLGTGAADSLWRRHLRRS